MDLQLEADNLRRVIDFGKDWKHRDETECSIWILPYSIRTLEYHPIRFKAMEEVQNEKCRELFDETTNTSFERNKREILFRESTKQTCADMTRGEL